MGRELQNKNFYVTDLTVGLYFLDTRWKILELRTKCRNNITYHNHTT